MIVLLVNILLGLIPTFALAWSVASDEKKPVEEKVVTSARDHRQQRRIFFFVYALWCFTLALWNWMSGSHLAWSVLWVVLGMIAGVLSRRRGVTES